MCDRRCREVPLAELLGTDRAEMVGLSLDDLLEADVAEAPAGTLEGSGGVGSAPSRGASDCAGEPPSDDRLVLAAGDLAPVGAHIFSTFLEFDVPATGMGLSEMPTLVEVS
jgi:hypothetical protein